MNGNILDIAVIIILLLNLYTNWRRGLILSIVQIGGVIVAVLVSRSFYKKFSYLLLENVEWVNNFKETMRLKINNVFAVQSQSMKREIVKSIQSDQLLENLDLPKYLKTSFDQYIYDLDLSEVTNINDTVADFIVNSVINLLSFIVLFVLVLLTIKIIGIVLDSFFKLPVLKGINQFGGLLFGFIIGNFYVFLCMAIITILISLGFDLPIDKYLESSKIAKVYYNNNVLLMIINYYL